IGVALDHGGAFDRHGHAGEPLPVGLDGAEIDGEHATSDRFVGRGGRIRRLQDGVVEGHGPVMTKLAPAVQRMEPLAFVLAYPVAAALVHAAKKKEKRRVMSIQTPEHAAEPKPLIPALEPFYHWVRELSWPLIRLTVGGTLLVHGIVKLMGPGI